MEKVKVFLLLTLMLMFSIPIFTQAFAAVPPVANAGSDQIVLVGSNVILDGTDSTGRLVSYSWVFGDGFQARLITSSVTHVYSNPGIYNVTLTVTDNNGFTASDTIKVTVTENIQLFFHNYVVVSRSENNSKIIIEGANALQPILNNSSYEKINCLQYGGRQEGQTIWGGDLMFQTSPLRTDLNVAGSVKIVFFVNSTDSFTRKQGGGYIFGVADINETNGAVAAFLSDIQGAGQGNPFTPKPSKITLFVNSVDHVFKAGHRIGFFIGVGGNKKGWSVGVFFDSAGSNSGAILPVVNPLEYYRFDGPLRGK